MQLQAREFKWGLSVTKWSDVKCSDVEWTDVIFVKWFCFEVKRSEVKWSEVKWSEVKWSEVKWSSWGQNCYVHEGDLILKVTECIVTISFGVYLVLWLF